MTTEHDELTQDQDSLDQQQEAQASAQPSVTMTPEQLTAFVSGQVQSATQPLLQQVRGLQGLIDKGLDAVRRDMRKEFLDAQRQGQLQQALQEVPEEHRPWAMKFASAMQQGQTIPEPEPTPTPQPTGNPQADHWMAQVQQQVTLMGGDPAKVDYQAALRGDMDAFYRSVGESVRTKGGAPAQQRTAQPQRQAQQTVNPPVNGAPPRGGGAYRTVDDIREAYIADHISLDEADKLARARGWQI